MILHRSPAAFRALSLLTAILSPSENKIKVSVLSCNSPHSRNVPNLLHNKTIFILSGHLLKVRVGPLLSIFTSGPQLVMKTWNSFLFKARKVPEALNSLQGRRTALLKSTVAVSKVHVLS